MKLSIRIVAIVALSALLCGCAFALESKNYKSLSNDVQTTAANPSDAQNTAKSGKQPLSNALSEADPRRSLKISEFLEKFHYSNYRLSRGEATQLFEFADQDHNDLVDFNEWQTFSSLFVTAFEACDEDKNNLLSVAELEKCFAKEKAAGQVQFRNSFGANKFKYLIEAVSCKGKDEINFSEYFLIRRGLFAWNACHTTKKYISVSDFKCAIRTAIPPKYQLKIDLEQIYNIGLRFANDKGINQLDYVSYQRIVYFTYVFSLIGSTQGTQFISKDQFLKFVKEQRYPTYFTVEEIEMIYSLINTNSFKTNQNMGFETFCYFFNMHRLFNQYSRAKPLQLSKTELLSLLDDVLMPQGMLLSIDSSVTNFTETEFEEAGVALQRLAPNERNYFYSFKQDVANTENDPMGDSTKPNHTYYDDHRNNTNREIFFSTMASTDKQYWTKETFFRAMELGNLFTSLCEDKRWIVPSQVLVSKLNNAYDTVNPPINFFYRSNYIIYRSINRDVHIDILNFLALENFRLKVKQHSISNNSEINGVSLKIILADYGMEHLPDNVIQVASTGFNELQNKVYNPNEVIKELVTITAVAGERRRAATINMDVHRKYNTTSILA